LGCNIFVFFNILVYNCRALWLKKNVFQVRTTCGRCKHGGCIVLRTQQEREEEARFIKTDEEKKVSQILLLVKKDNLDGLVKTIASDDAIPDNRNAAFPCWEIANGYDQS